MGSLQRAVRRLQIASGFDHLLANLLPTSMFLKRAIPSPYYYSSEDRLVHIRGLEWRVNLADAAMHRVMYRDLDSLVRFTLVAVADAATVIDVGANIGLWAVPLAYRRNTSIDVYAFEPNPAIANYLQDNITRNSVSMNVELFNMALSERSSVATLQVPHRNTGCGSLQRDYQTERHDRFVVKCEPLDAVLSQRQPRFPIRFIKIDVEGHESAVLAGARNTIALHRPIIFMEHNNADCMSLLFAMGYRVFAAAFSSNDVIGVAENDATRLTKYLGPEILKSTTHGCAR